MFNLKEVEFFNNLTNDHIFILFISTRIFVLFMDEIAIFVVIQSSLVLNAINLESKTQTLRFRKKYVKVECSHLAII